RQFVDDRIDELNQAVQSTVRVPPKLERTLDRIDRNNLVVRSELSDPDGFLDRLAKQLVFGLLLSAGVLSTVLLYIVDDLVASVVSLVFCLVVIALLYRSFREKQGIRTHPQFTRQNMRERRDDE